MVTGHFQELEDEYLETLYDFHEKTPGIRVRNGDLAQYLDLSPASVTEMIQRLSRNGFVDYIPYKGALLTESGKKHGMMIKRMVRENKHIKMVTCMMVNGMMVKSMVGENTLMYMVPNTKEIGIRIKSMVREHTRI